MPTLAETLRDQLTRHLVSKAITCPRTGALLDVRTCVIVNDLDGDPMSVRSPEGWAQIGPDTRDKLAASGLTVDER